jgi:pyruvate dehydrogenase E2 component (dihydrolipoamide acetyltransferase)
MPTDVIMPALGVAQQTGTLLKWLKAEGQTVTKGEPLMEVETDKAMVEIEAAASGILAAVSAKAGDQVPVGQRIALILAPGEVAAPAAVQERRPGTHPSPLPKGEGIREGHPLSMKEGKTEARSGPNSEMPNEGYPPPRREGISSNHPLPQGEGRGEGFAAARVLASPAAKRLAKEKGIPLRDIQGSGPEGSVLAQDVLRAALAAATSEHHLASTTASGDLLPLSAMRRIVGQRMTQSKQSTPHFYVNMDIDMTSVLALRSRWQERGETSIPSINDFVLYACARALRDFPAVNSTYGDKGIKIHADINIGMAVALEEGLVVPVIRDADRLTLADLAAQAWELARKAQSKKLFPLDYEGGTFTVSNLGMLGVDSFIAIINPPQCAILAVGRVAPRVVTDGDGLEIKSMMTATLSADHRIIDGAIGARFLNAVKRQLETAPG